MKIGAGPNTYKIQNNRKDKTLLMTLQLSHNFILLLFCNRIYQSHIPILTIDSSQSQRNTSCRQSLLCLWIMHLDANVPKNTGKIPSVLIFPKHSYFLLVDNSSSNSITFKTLQQEQHHQIFFITVINDTTVARYKDGIPWHTIEWSQQDKRGDSLDNRSQYIYI